MLLYVQTVDTTTDFYIDDAILAQENKISSNSSNIMRGDINQDGEIDVFDIPLMRNTVLNSSAKSVTNTAADIDGDGNIAINDAVLLNQYIYGKIDSFPTANNTDA